MATGNVISKAAESIAGSNNKKITENPQTLIQEIFDKNGYTNVLVALDYYIDIIKSSHPVMIKYMTAQQKFELQSNLKIAYLLLLTQTKHEYDYQKVENFKKYTDLMTQCRSLLALIGTPMDPILEGLEVQKALLTNQPKSWLIAPEISVTKTLTDNMNWINSKRLYWIWGSSFITAILSLLPATYYYVEQASSAMELPNPYTGTMSWALYYLRFSVHLSMLLKNTVKGPWLSDEDKKSQWWQLPWQQRFARQWDQRKFALLNDSLWATANLLCFFWLVGSGVLGHWGSVLTIVLLAFDLSASIWDYAEQVALKNSELHSFNEHITALKQLKALTSAQALQLKTLENAKRNCERNWIYKKYDLYNNMAYALSLMVAFVLMTLPFLPLTIPALLATSVVGTVLCFILTVVSTAIQGAIEIYKELEQARDISSEHDEKIDLFKKYQKNGNLSASEMKFLYLEIQSLLSKSEYQKQIIFNKSIHLVRSVSLSLFSPAVILASLIFLPTGVGFAVLAAYIALAVVSSHLIDKHCKVEDVKELQDINEKYYQEFASKPEVQKLSYNNQSFSFFKRNKTEERIQTINSHCPAQ